MGDEFAEIHDELRAVARGLLGKADRESGVEWSRMAASGWLGLEAAAEFDGAAATFAEVAVVLEEVGRAAARTAFSSVAVVSMGVLGACGPGVLRDRLIRQVVGGEVVPVVALSGERGGTRGMSGDTGVGPEDASAARVEGFIGSGGAAFRLTADGGLSTLSGSAAFVADAPLADLLLIPARLPDGSVAVAVVEPGAAGMTVVDQPVVDATRVFGRVVAERVTVAPETVLRFDGDAETALGLLHERAALATACDSLGIGAAMLDATVEYVRVREQFGRPVGSFQAVQHACADMLVRLSVARQLVAAAVRAQVDRTPDAGPAASMAKAYTTAAAVDIAGKAMQLHGGIGYTWESGLHVYLKRATLNRSLFGNPAWHRAELARGYGGDRA
ncbi:acyl-CoA dehydrogenase family protein [Nocardia blacklockiae]|uniref:acyl-CoA dehydrogenase family protein n=1 Tax=Nocardia blacklockiae TaxID=480036 RepID=UPI003F696EDB